MVKRGLFTLKHSLWVMIFVLGVEGRGEWRGSDGEGMILLMGVVVVVVGEVYNWLLLCVVESFFGA